ncbi:hypothetical protein [Nocardia stercoris]|uniref:Uncharacterized protein n=1 Tax=Nocardia stercoris TaxID=2483361 RepID=A0A3M2KW85_9NOCA|nr:hypothetical protein [Nocardia stercoris]RMI28720.1 hypothetical protein EBN03_29205 [Nocardia stercoris]
MDWRSTASRRAQDDLDNLLRDSLTLAGESLGATRSFAPFMLVIGVDGSKQLRRFEAEGADENTIRDTLTMDRDPRELRARATVYDVTARQPFPGDAIKVAAEHVEGVAIDLLVPYVVDQESVRIDMNSAYAAVAPARLWG